MSVMFPKTKKVRKPKRKPLTKLQSFARGQDCSLRLVGVCSRNPETVVLCHVKPSGFGAMASKPNDLHGVHACSCCHSFIDGGYVGSDMTKAEVEAELFRAMFETQNRVIDSGMIEVA